MGVQISPWAQVETSAKMVGSKAYREAIREQSEIRPPLAGMAQSHNSPQRMETTQTKTKCVLYARKSTEEDDQQIMSIEAQLFELREYASRERIEIVKVFTEAKSAKKPG